jgi:AbrB family looped-hinge helix DNA binding protein
MDQSIKKCVWAVKVDARGRATIPKDLLELLQIGSGDIMVFAKENEGPIYVGKAKLDIDIPFMKEDKRKNQS